VESHHPRRAVRPMALLGAFLTMLWASMTSGTMVRTSLACKVAKSKMARREKLEGIAYVERRDVSA